MNATRWETIATIDVTGIPKTAGSKRYVGQSKAGRAIIIDDSGKKGKDWRHNVSAACMEAGVPVRGGPLSAIFRFRLPRPKGHFRAGDATQALKDTAPNWPTKIPDALKLTRSAEDAATKILWHDDAQIVRELIAKDFADHRPPGLSLTIQKPTPLAWGDLAPMHFVRAVLEWYATPGNYLYPAGPNSEPRIYQDMGALARKAGEALDRIAGTL